MIISGATPIKTYFVLNKKDRSGNIQSRPFQQVLEEMKRQEIEEIKAKQLTNLKNEYAQNRPPSAPKSNGITPGLSENNIKPISVEIPVSAKVNDRVDAASHLVRNSISKSKINNDQPTKPSEDVGKSKKSIQRQSQSRTCQLL